MTLSKGGKLLVAMGIRKQIPRPGGVSTDTGGSRATRDYVEEVRRRVAGLGKPVENETENNSRDDSGNQQQIQERMAQLRAEAVQARRLAEHINTLSQEATKRKRKPVMTDTTIVDPEHTHQQNRRTSDKPRTGGRQSSFNPLHPSMELPPEQLIRLLGLEGKKIRKKSKPVRAKVPAGAVSRPAASVPAAEIRPVPETLPPMRAETSVARRAPRKQRSRQDLSAFPERRSGLLLPALGLGVLAGLAVTAYLFWWQPAPAGMPAARSAGTGESVAPAKALPVKRTQPLPVPAPARQVTQPAKPTQPELATDPKWRTALTAREQQLRAAAEQRLNQRIQEAGRGVRQPEANTAVAPPAAVDKIEGLPGSMGTESGIPAQNPAPTAEIQHAEALEASPAVAAEAAETAAAQEEPANLTAPAPFAGTDPAPAPDNPVTAPAPARDAEPAPDASAFPESNAGTQGVPVTPETGEQTGEATTAAEVPAAALAIEPGEAAQSEAPDAVGAPAGDVTE
jgi:hypothetical protein